MPNRTQSGLLGIADPEAGLLSRFGRFTADNAPMLLAIGTGLMQGANPGRTFADGAQIAFQNGLAAQQNMRRNQLIQAQIAELQNQQTPTTSLYKNLVAAGLVPGSPEFERAMLTVINKPQTVINNVPKLEGGMVPIDPNDLSKGVKPIPGGSKDPASSKEFRDLDRKMGRVTDAVNNYETMLRRHGAEILPGKAKLEMQTAYTNLLLELKEAFNLGVLNGPDLELMQKVILDPTSMAAKAHEMRGGTEALLGQLSMVRDKLKESRQRANRQYGVATESPKGGKIKRYNPATGRIE